MNLKEIEAAARDVAALAGSVAVASSVPSSSATTTYHRTQVDGVGIFHREAGPKHAPTIVLLPGFPSSSRYYDMLIPLLATRYHVVAPDYPAFEQSDRLPSRPSEIGNSPAGRWPLRPGGEERRNRSSYPRFHGAPSHEGGSDRVEYFGQILVLNLKSDRKRNCCFY